MHFSLKRIKHLEFVEGHVMKAKVLIVFQRNVFSDTNILKTLTNIAPNIGGLSRNGAVVRALASHQCGPGSIPTLGVICGLSLLLVLVLAPRGFCPGSPVFTAPSTKTNIPKFQFTFCGSH